MRKITLLFLFLLTTLAVLSAQNGWSGGLQIGYATMGGDLIEDDKIIINQPHLGGGIFLRRQVGQLFGLRANLMMGKFAADDAKSELPVFRERGWSTRTFLGEGSLVLEFAPFEGRRYRDGVFRRILSPYVYGGIGLTYFNPDADFNGRTNADILADQSTAIDNTQLSYPLGLGVRYDLNQRMQLGLDWGLRIIRTDYLDGISQAGNPDRNDAYIFAGLQLVTRFGVFDADKDGIADAEDACPDQPGSAALAGCPDTDGDGVADRDDRCPDMAGVAALGGCPDTDGDRVVDSEDNCPTVPGLAALGGCPDTDLDGIADAEDQCPDNKGPRATFGCPDENNNGIADRDEPATIRGSIDLTDPEQPDLPERVVEVTAIARVDLNSSLVIELPNIQFDRGTNTFIVDDIHFATDTSALTPEAQLVLDQVIAVAEGNEGLRLMLSGHADSRYTEPYNLALSERRVTAAERYLTDAGIDPARIETNAYGEQRPAVPNTGPQNWYLNRRVEIQVR